MFDRVCYSINHDGYVTWISKNVTEMMGWGQYEVLGKHFFDFIPADDHEKVIKNRLNRKAGVTQEYQTTLLRKDGERESVRIRTLQTPENTVGSIDRRLTSRPIRENYE